MQFQLNSRGKRRGWGLRGGGGRVVGRVRVRCVCGGAGGCGCHFKLANPLIRF